MSLTESCETRDAVAKPQSSKVSRHRENNVIVLRTENRITTFQNKYEFKTFLKMLMRFDESL